MTTKEELQELNKDFIEFSSKVDEFIDTFGERLNSAAKGLNKEQPYGLWNPKEREKYWTIMPTRASVDYYIWENADEENVDSFNLSIGNCFKTKEQAEKHLEHLKVETQLRDIAARLNKGSIKDFDYRTFSIYLDTVTMVIKSTCGTRFKAQGAIYCYDSKFKDIAIAEIGEDRLKEYLKEC